MDLVHVIGTLLHCCLWDQGDNGGGYLKKAKSYLKHGKDNGSHND